MAEPTPPRIAPLAAFAALLHFGFDSLTRVATITSPPYLLTPYMSDVFHDMLEMLGRTAVSGVTSFVNGVITAIFAIALAEPAAGRLRKLTLFYFGVWVLSGGLIFAIYLTAPAGVVAGSLLTGLPRAFVLAWFMDRKLRPSG